MIIRAYLRASTNNQDASRAKSELKAFTDSLNLRIASYCIENISGTTLSRPELSKLISDSESGDILLIEKLDRLTRLPYEQWQTLKGELTSKGIKIVVLDLPMTHQQLSSDLTTSALMKVISDFIIELASVQARDDYETRVKRQKQGIAKAKEQGLYKGRKINTELHKAIKTMLESGCTWSNIQTTLKCSRSTISRVKGSLL